MKMNILLIFLTCLSLWACEKTEMDNPIDPKPTPFFEIKWFTRIDSTKEVVGSDNTQHYKDWVIVTGDLNDPPTIIAFSKKSGKLEWSFSDKSIIKYRVDKSIIFNNLYIGICSDGIWAVNLDTKSTQWIVKYETNDFTRGYNFTILGNKLYTGVIKAHDTPESEKMILEIDPISGNFKTIYSAKGLDLSPHVFYIDPVSMDTLIIFNEYPNNGDTPGKAKQNIKCYNLTKKSVMWSNENFTQFYSTNILHPPVIYKDIVITGGDWSMYGFDIKTGKPLWKTSIPGYTQFGIWNKTNHLIIGDRLYVNPDGFEVLCLHPATGVIIWNNPEGGPNCTDNMVYYKDMLVFTSWGYGSVMVLNALTGETLHRERKLPPASSGDTYNNDVVYDPVTDMFFTSSYKNAVGFKINK